MTPQARRFTLIDRDRPQRTLIRIAFWTTVLLVPVFAGTQLHSAREPVERLRKIETIAPRDNKIAPARPPATTAPKTDTSPAKPPRAKKRTDTRHPKPPATQAGLSSRPAGSSTSTGSASTPVAPPTQPRPSRPSGTGGTSSGGAAGGSTSTAPIGGDTRPTPTQPVPGPPTTTSPQPDPPVDQNCDPVNETC